MKRFLSKPMKTCLMALSLLAPATLFTSQAAAQATITLGGNDEQIFRILQQNGYDTPRITSRKLTIIRTEACKGNDKFLVKVSILGRITSTTKLGRCDLRANAEPQLRINEVRAKGLLVSRGYSDVKILESGPNLAASGCAENRRFEFRFNRFGKVTSRQDVGPCRERGGMTDNQIAQLMAKQGFRRVVVTDNQLPKYVAEGCRDGQRFRVSMNRRGIVRSERRIGECGRQFNPENIQALLRDQGFNRIEIMQRRRPPFVAQGCRGGDRLEVEIGRYGRLRSERKIASCALPIDPANMAVLLEQEGFDRVKLLRSSPPYLVEACNENELMELTVGRYGKIRNQEEVGSCATPISDTDLITRLRNKGLMDVQLARRNDGWRVEACREDAKLEMLLDAYGDTIQQRGLGDCQSRTVLEVLQTLESRGAERVYSYVQGCYRGKRYVWEFDRLGNRTGRRSTGNC